MQNQTSQTQVSFRRSITHATLLELYDLWQLSRGDNPAMPRSSLDPIKIPHLLKNLILVDVARGVQSLRYRLVGTEIVAAHGIDYTGKTLEELTSGATLGFTRNLYGTVIGQAVPVFSQGRFRWEGKEHCWTKRLHLPLTRDGENIDVVLVGQVYETAVIDRPEEVRPARPEELANDRTALNQL